MQAWRKLKALVESGACERDVIEYARQLGRGLPDIRDPQACAQQAEAVAQVVQEILGGAQ